MRKDQFRQLMQETFRSLEKLTESKGEEYSRSDDQLANFKRTAEDLCLDPMQVWLVLFNKHRDAIVSYINTLDRVVLSEPIEGRIDDAILYLLLFKAIIQERRGVSEETCDRDARLRATAKDFLAMRNP